MLYILLVDLELSINFECIIGSFRSRGGSDRGRGGDRGGGGGFRGRGGGLFTSRSTRKCCDVPL